MGKGRELEVRASHGVPTVCNALNVSEAIVQHRGDTLLAPHAGSHRPQGHSPHPLTASDIGCQDADMNKTRQGPILMEPSGERQQNSGTSVSRSKRDRHLDGQKAR